MAQGPHKPPKVLGKYVKRTIGKSHLAFGNVSRRERIAAGIRNERQPAIRNGRRHHV